MTVRALAHAASAFHAPNVLLFGSAEELQRTLAEPGLSGAALLSDGIPAIELEPVTDVVANSRAAIIEVRTAGWDGVSGSPLSAACRGVISGFGENGLWTAVALLEEESRVPAAPSAADS